MKPAAEEARSLCEREHPDFLSPSCPSCQRILAVLTSRDLAAREEERERCIAAVRAHLDKAATIRQAVAQPGMVPELSPERKQEEHRIAAATLALGPPLSKALRSLPPVKP